MDNLISRQAAIDEINKYILSFDAIDANFLDGLKIAIKLIKEDLPSAQPEPKWHVIKKRPMTNDERIEWSERIGYDEDAFIYSNLPDDGEEVLVSSQYGHVYVDEFCQDEGCYFEENGDMDGIVAWMPLPKPYQEGAT